VIYTFFTIFLYASRIIGFLLSKVCCCLPSLGPVRLLIYLFYAFHLYIFGQMSFYSIAICVGLLFQESKTATIERIEFILLIQMFILLNYFSVESWAIIMQLSIRDFPLSPYENLYKWGIVLGSSCLFIGRSSDLLLRCRFFILITSLYILLIALESAIQTRIAFAILLGAVGTINIFDAFIQFGSWLKKDETKKLEAKSS